MCREDSKKKTKSGGAEPSRGLEDKGNNRVGYRCVRSGDPSVMPAFELLLALGRAVLIDRRENGVLQIRGASRTYDCNIDQ